VVAVIYVDELRPYPQKSEDATGGAFFGNGALSCHMMTDGSPHCGMFLSHKRNKWNISGIVIPLYRNGATVPEGTTEIKWDNPNEAR
jgi:hypothetical protein